MRNAPLILTLSHLLGLAGCNGTQAALAAKRQARTSDAKAAATPAAPETSPSPLQQQDLEEETADEPQLVVGAFLACGLERTPPPEKADPNMRTFGCAMIASGGVPLQGAFTELAVTHVSEDGSVEHLDVRPAAEGRWHFLWTARADLAPHPGILRWQGMFAGTAVFGETQAPRGNADPAVHVAFLTSATYRFLREPDASCAGRAEAAGRAESGWRALVDGDEAKARMRIVLSAPVVDTLGQLIATPDAFWEKALAEPLRLDEFGRLLEAETSEICGMGLRENGPNDDDHEGNEENQDPTTDHDHSCSSLFKSRHLLCVSGAAAEARD